MNPLSKSFWQRFSPFIGCLFALLSFLCCAWPFQSHVVQFATSSLGTGQPVLIYACITKSIPYATFYQFRYFRLEIKVFGPLQTDETGIWISLFFYWWYPICWIGPSPPTHTLSFNTFFKYLCQTWNWLVLQGQNVLHRLLGNCHQPSSSAVDPAFHTTEGPCRACFCAIVKCLLLG